MTQFASHAFTSGADRSPITDDRLTIADLTRHLEPHGMNRSTIQRYDSNTDLQAALGKKDGKYPASSLPFWMAIAQARAQEPPLVKPETSAIFVQSLADRSPITDDRLSVSDYRLPVSGQRSESEALVLAREVGGEVTRSLQQLVMIAESVNGDTVERLIGAMERHSNALERLPAPDDTLLNIEQVQTIIPRSDAWIRKYVPSVGKGRTRMWKKSEVNAFIFSLK